MKLKALVKSCTCIGRSRQDFDRPQKEVDFFHLNSKRISSNFSCCFQSVRMRDSDKPLIIGFQKGRIGLDEKLKFLHFEPPRRTFEIVGGNLERPIFENQPR